MDLGKDDCDHNHDNDHDNDHDYNYNYDYDYKKNIITCQPECIIRNIDNSIAPIHKSNKFYNLDIKYQESTKYIKSIPNYVCGWFC